MAANGSPSASDLLPREGSASRWRATRPNMSPAKLVMWTIVSILAFVILALTATANFILFHTLAELSVVAITWAVFLTLWNSRRFVDNDALVVLGIFFGYTGFVDLVHALAYRGMGILAIGVGVHVVLTIITLRG
jgi:hypothetical protein